MIYFSELRGKKILTEDNVLSGYLEDFVFLATETPKVTKMIIRTEKGKKLTVPIAYVSRINEGITIKKNFIEEEMVANEIFVLKNLLDKQIIDLKGQKVVRVNDVVIQEHPFLYIAGVDVGVLGILRQLGIERPITHALSTFKIRLSSDFLSWGYIQPIELAYGRVLLKKEQTKLERVKPEDLADSLEKTNILNVRKILKILDDRTAADVIKFLNINYQASIFRHYRPERAVKILTLMDPDEAVDVLLTLSSKKRQQLVDLLDETKRKEIQYLLGLSKTPIGSILTTEYIAVDSQITAREVIEKIKKETVGFSFLRYVYALNKQNQLIGVFNLYELILQKPETPVYKFMIQNIVVIHLTTPEEIAVKKMLKYRLQSLPVINDNKELLGIVNFDDLSRRLLPKDKI
ncbi:magnesium transporter [Candidatus Roizmanbacteria bacterium]|nr:magnesium transporter [Candidatus Roizmanbacteria bacterium]